MPGVLLPIEVEEHILHHIYFDRKTLKTCTLVCRAWARTTRPILFRLVELRDRAGCLRLLSLLEGSRRTHTGLCHYVRELQLHRIGFPTRPSRQNRSSMRIDLLRRIASHLPMVEVLRFQRFRVSDLMRCLWAEKDTQTIQDVVFSTLCFPRLKEIYCWYLNPVDIDDLLQVFGAYPNLSAVHLDVVADRTRDPLLAHDRIDMQNYTEMHRVSPIVIRELWVGKLRVHSERRHKFFSALNAAPFTLRLERLGWVGYGSRRQCPDSAHTLRTLLHESRETLEYLQLNLENLRCTSPAAYVHDTHATTDFPAHDIASFPRDLNLSHLACVKTITFSMDVHVLSESTWEHVPGCLSTLSSPCLQNVEFHFWSWHHWLFAHELFGWAPLNNALLSLHARCPALAVTIRCLRRARDATTAGENPVSPDCFSPQAIEILRARLAPLLAKDVSITVVGQECVVAMGWLGESSGNVVRSTYVSLKN